MSKKTLLDVIFASDKRKNVLLILKNSPKEMEALLKSLKTTRQALLPQMRILEDHHLITRLSDVYKLTTIGELIADEMIPLLYTVNVLDHDIDFWGERDLEFIPPELLDRIHELGEYEINEPSISNIHELNKEFTETSATSSKMCAVTTIFHPNFMDLFALWTQNRTEITMVISEELFQKLKEDYLREFQELLDDNYIRFYLYDKPFNFVYFALNDECILMTMLTKEGWYDNKELISLSSTALEWGRSLFAHYLKDSRPITEI
ncbi:helix-turn-helix transcriptional regulator [Methanolobus halotolerans]|uniref:Transcriptional regulator n=1 Tax=Methanolobus halotolerans TaxID=2052935 RepID=A0A4E0PT63_9EURY|nr:winged helix-turn-helix domain-containing protein [Methanolobus halotolerans]TGC07496.1 transcriptional regulator [Methanolobus halotolerans]